MRYTAKFVLRVSSGAVTACLISHVIRDDYENKAHSIDGIVDWDFAGR